jgi:hypothetical protein
MMTKTATDWIAWLEAEPRSEPDLSIATVLREQAAEIERLGRDLAAARLLLDERPLTDEPSEESDAPEAYEIEFAINIARLWRAGKMIGGDEHAVRNALLAEVERLRVNRTEKPDGT